jgi:hypothetical protein
MLKALESIHLAMRILLFGHLGIGDHIYMNGLVHTLISNLKDIGLEEVCIIACDDYRKQTLIHMYEDYPIVSFCWLPTNTTPIHEIRIFQLLNRSVSGNIVSMNDKMYILHTFGLHSALKDANPLDSLGYNWADSLYLVPLAINPLNRYTMFQCPKNLIEAELKYRHLLSMVGHSNYVLIHDDPSRDRIMDKNTVFNYLEQDGMKEMTILYLGKDRYSYPLLEGLNNVDVGNLLECKSLFDLTYILANAKACHLMDSSIACLADVLGITCKLYMHSYMMHNTGKSFQRKHWVRIESTQAETL